jgi:hypothetical protein
MEDVLEVYQRPHDPDYPLVCVDESSKQLINETRTPIAMKPGQPARYDEYKRNGTANLFMMFAPLEGWRHVKVTDRQRPLIMPMFSKSCRMFTFRTPRKLCSFKITSILTHQMP